MVKNKIIIITVCVTVAILVMVIIGIFSSVSFNNGVLFLYPKELQKPYTGSIVTLNGQRDIDSKGYDAFIFSYRKVKIESKYYWTVRIFIYRLCFVLLPIVFIFVASKYFKKKIRGVGEHQVPNDNKD